LLSSALDNAPTYYSFLSAIVGGFVPADLVEQLRQLIASGTVDPSAITGPNAVNLKQALGALSAYHPTALAAGTLDAEQLQVAFLLGKADLNHFIVAISIAAVFFGANTYIGNGPNFMVKSIADESKVHTPGFIGYILRYTVPYMLPLLLLIWVLFFR
jgi:Na+/H+ antiporter NhaD/arsenite permease-like protein